MLLNDVDCPEVDCQNASCSTVTGYCEYTPSSQGTLCGTGLEGLRRGRRLLHAVRRDHLFGAMARGFAGGAGLAGAGGSSGRGSRAVGYPFPFQAKIPSSSTAVWG